MSKKIGKIERELGYNYRIDKEGNIIKEKYKWIKDPYTLVTIAIIILGCLHYLQINQMNTTEANFEESCMNYIEARNIWIQNNPGEIPTLKEVLSVEIK